jgi:hypothetical protein
MTTKNVLVARDALAGEEAERQQAARDMEAKRLRDIEATRVDLAAREEANYAAREDHERALEDAAGALSAAQSKARDAQIAASQARNVLAVFERDHAERAAPVHAELDRILAAAGERLHGNLLGVRRQLATGQIGSVNLAPLVADFIATQPEFGERLRALIDAEPLAGFAPLSVLTEDEFSARRLVLREQLDQATAAEHAAGVAVHEAADHLRRTRNPEGTY